MKDGQDAFRAPGEGPYCPFCGNASLDKAANLETFDIAEHVARCRARAEEVAEQQAELAAEMEEALHPEWRCPPRE